MDLYSNGDKKYSRELVKYYNSCPECYSRNIIPLFQDIDGVNVLNRRTKKVVGKDVLDYRIHKDTFYCQQCNYFDFLDVFREREINVLGSLLEGADYEDIYSVLRLQYICYLRKKFSLTAPHQVWENNFNNDWEKRKEG